MKDKMKTSAALTALIVIGLIVGCEKQRNLPPSFESVDNIIVDGQKMTAREYREKYCKKEQRMEYDDERRCTVVIDKVLSQASSTENPNSSIYGQGVPELD